MILDPLQNWRRLAVLHPGFAAAFEYLERPELADLSDGRHVVDGDRLFVMVARGPGNGREKALLECHRRFIDIQYVVQGVDQIGWMPTADCQRVSTPFDSEKDFGLFFDRPETWLSVPAGSFAIFYPEDAHAPLGCELPVHKAVVKVAVDW